MGKRRTARSKTLVNAERYAASSHARSSGSVSGHGFTVGEIGDIFWEVAHKLDAGVPWVRLGADLDAEIRLGGSELLVLELLDGSDPQAGYVCLVRIEIDCDISWTVEVLHSAKCPAARTAELARHAEDRTGQPVIEGVITSGHPRQGATLLVTETLPMNTVEEILL